METGLASLVRPQAAEVRALAPFTVAQGDPAGGFLVLCDHAHNHVPAGYASLGLPPDEFHRHIAYDPGAEALSSSIARRLGVPAVFSTFSRLLIDPNRGEDDPTLIMRISDGAIVPGNRHVDAEERQARIDRFHAPYHDAVAAAIDAGLASGVVPAVISIHSYTPVWRGKPRPWHAGILWDRDPRLAVPLIEALRAEPELIVGDNEPYSGSLANDTLNRHATARGIAHALIEVRQDLIADESGVERWAARLARILLALNTGPDIHTLLTPESAGSRSLGVAAV
ncbi:MAG: N-formylglutamate amidohydrolase [Alphaproteobacteria bacterium]